MSIRPSTDPDLTRPVSLSQFYPFVLADSMAKRSRAESIRRVHAIPSPAVDYWRLLRLQIVAHHQIASSPRPEPADAVAPLDGAIELSGADRIENYTKAVTNYRRFLGRKQIEWIDQPRRAIWLADRLKLRVDPELHVTIDGDPHVIKLYLKADPKLALNQRTANPLAWLLQSCHGHLGRPLVLDVLRGRAFGLTRHGGDHEATLRAQAAAFVTLWEGEGSAGSA
ncbi:MAG: hypothetical protein AAFO29_25555, partial [Actinomycetota bacterium]